jgi:hypothetical protein
MTAPGNDAASGLTHLKFSRGWAHKLSECEATRRALFPRGTERVAGGRAQRRHRNAVPKTAHPAKGWQGICPLGGLRHPSRDASGIGAGPARRFLALFKMRVPWAPPPRDLDTPPTRP